MGLFAALLNEELVRENSTMRNYKTAVVGTGECEIIYLFSSDRPGKEQRECVYALHTVHSGVAGGK